MRLPECRVIVQQQALYQELWRKYRMTDQILFDRRMAERRRGALYGGPERRRKERRRTLTPDERTMWTDLRHPLLYRDGEQARWSSQIAEAWAVYWSVGGLEQAGKW